MFYLACLCSLIFFSCWLLVDLLPGQAAFGENFESMSRDKHRKGDKGEVEGKEGKESVPNSGDSEFSMMDMFRVLMQENREAEAARETKRELREREAQERNREAEEAREKKREILEKEAHERVLVLKEKDRVAQLELKDKERELELLKQKRQDEFEAKQLDGQMKLMKSQVELAERTNQMHREAQEKDRNRGRVLTSISEWKEGDDLDEFFLMAEGRMKAVDIKMEEWIGIIDQKLRGKAMLAWQNAVTGAADYWEAKRKILKVCGYTPKAAAEALFGFKPERCGGLTAAQLYHEGQQLVRRLIAPGTVSEEVEFALVKGWICNVTPKGARRALDYRVLGSPTDLIEALQDYLAIEGVYKFGQAATFKLEPVGQSEKSKERLGSPLVCFKCGRAGHKAVDCWQIVSAGQGRPPGGEGYGGTINCFTCGVEGHKSPQCPKNLRGEKLSGKEGHPEQAKRVLRIRRGDTKGITVDGTINGWASRVLLDSGAAISLVSEDLVCPRQLTGKTVAVTDLGEKHPWWLPTAEVQFVIAGSVWIEVVGVAPKQMGLKEDAIYSWDVRTERGWALARLARKEPPREISRATTRAEHSRKQEKAVAELTKLAACSPVVTPLPGGRDVFNGPGVEGVTEVRVTVVKKAFVAVSPEEDTVNGLVDLPLVKEPLTAETDPVNVVVDDENNFDGIIGLFAEDNLLLDVTEAMKNDVVGLYDAGSVEEARFIKMVELRTDDAILGELVEHTKSDDVSLAKDNVVEVLVFQEEEKELVFVREDVQEGLCSVDVIQNGFVKDSSEDDRRVEFIMEVEGVATNEVVDVGRADVRVEAEEVIKSGNQILEEAGVTFSPFVKVGSLRARYLNTGSWVVFAVWPTELQLQLPRVVLFGRDQLGVRMPTVKIRLGACFESAHFEGKFSEKLVGKLSPGACWIFVFMLGRLIFGAVAWMLFCDFGWMFGVELVGSFSALFIWIMVELEWKLVRRAARMLAIIAMLKLVGVPTRGRRLEVFFIVSTYIGYWSTSVLSECGCLVGGDARGLQPVKSKLC